MRNAAVHLCLGFVEVGIKRLLELLHQSGKIAHQRLAAGVFRMETEAVGDQRIELGILGIFVCRLLRGAAKIVCAANKRGAKTGVDGGGGDALPRKIHVKHHGDPAGEVFHDGEFGEDIDIIRRELRFLGEDLLKQPTLQGHIVRKGTQKSHAAVCMRVLKPRHEQVAVAVDLAIGNANVAALFSKRGNAPADNDELAGEQFCLAVQRQYSCIIKSRYHATILT